jgi:hypothetical protein
MSRLLTGNVSQRKNLLHIYFAKLRVRQGAMAEWLKREIRNLFLSEGAGSNPAGVGVFVDFIYSPCPDNGDDLTNVMLY